MTAEGQVSLPTPPSLESLLQEGPVALFLDFDGTLVELAPGPDQIEPIADLNAKLVQMAERLGGRCAIVSGRAIADIESHIGEISLAAAGSHGSDVRSADGRALGEAPTGLPAALEAELRSYASENAIDYEAKPHGGALHYRSNPQAGEAAQAFAQDLAARHGWSAQSGKCVVELVAGKADKGTAVRALMQEEPFAGARPIFIGDDLTDEKGFAACNEAGGAGILVGTREPTCAQYQLPNVASVHQWLGL
ncbi:MAG: trehalose-phosphatase [Pseudomonadota bacterium]